MAEVAAADFKDEDYLDVISKFTELNLLDQQDWIVALYNYLTQ